MRVWTKHESGPPRRVAPVAGRENAMISKLTVPVFRAWSRGRGQPEVPKLRSDSPVGRQPPDDLVRAVGESKSPGDDPTGGVSPPVGICARSDDPAARRAHFGAMGHGRRRKSVENHLRQQPGRARRGLRGVRLGLWTGLPPSHHPDPRLLLLTFAAVAGRRQGSAGLLRVRATATRQARPQRAIMDFRGRWS